MFRSVTYWTRRILLSCSLAAAASAALAEGTPPAIHFGAVAPAEAVESIQAPAATAEVGLSAPALVTREARSSDPLDRGSSFTDGGDGLPSATPNALELTKLSMARAAVEASRLAGTLYPSPEELEPPALSESELDAIKMERLRGIEPIVPLPDPVAMVGIDVSPVQAHGPEGLSATEAAKLAAPPSHHAPAPDWPAVPESPQTGKEIH